MKKKSISSVALIILLILSSCNRKEKVTSDVSNSISTTVSITQPSRQNIVEYIHLNGVSVFQKRDNLRSTVTGYIRGLKFRQGDRIKNGEIFCLVGTKEQEALKNLALTDTSLLKFKKPISIISNVSGIISNITLLEGDYVSEGDIIATVSEPQSLIIQVNVPYEYNQLVNEGKKCEILLPDGKIIQSVITGKLPTVEINSQSQTYFIRVPNESLPENLNVTILISKDQKENALCIITTAVQTDEMQKNYWLMKVVNGSLARKIAIETGLQNDSITEIISKNITIKDIIITDGAYGLEDSTLIQYKK